MVRFVQTQMFRKLYLILSWNHGETVSMPYFLMIQPMILSLKWLAYTRNINSHKAIYSSFIFDSWLFYVIMSNTRIKWLSLHRLRSLVRDGKAVLWFQNRQNSSYTKHRNSSTVGCFTVCIWAFADVWNRMVGSSLPYALLIIQYTQRIAEKKFLVFGRVLPIERLCSTRFQQISYFAFPILCNYHFTIITYYTIFIFAFYIIIIFV